MDQASKIIGYGATIIPSSISGYFFDMSVKFSSMITNERVRLPQTMGMKREKGEMEIVFPSISDTSKTAVIMTCLDQDGTLDIESFIECMEKFFKYDFKKDKMFLCLHLTNLRGSTWGILKQYLLSTCNDRKVEVIFITEQEHEKSSKRSDEEKRVTGEGEGAVEE